MSRTFSIPEENIVELQKIMERIGKRAIKLGFPPPKFTIGDKSVANVDVITEGISQKKSMFVHKVEVEGVQPVLADWKFRGKIEHLNADGANIIKGSVPEKYFTCPPDCDHCELKRNRSETYILEHVETSELKQVGSSCLTDFFNGDNPLNHASLLEQIWRVYEELDALQESNAITAQSVSAGRVLEIGSAIIRKSGYISSQRAEATLTESTAAIMKMVLFENHPDYPVPTVLDEDEAKAKSVLSWLQSDEFQSRKSEGEYMNNLCVLAEFGEISRKNTGIFVSSLIAYDRHIQDIQAKASASVSKHIGTPTEKLAGIPVTVVGKTIIPGDTYGPKTLYRFQDDGGNIIVWYCSGDEIASTGDRLHLNATVKKHDVFRDVKQTVVLRATSAESKLQNAIAEHRDEKTIAKLMKQPFFIDNGNVQSKTTALMIAAREGDIVSLRALLEAGANPDAVDRHGNAACHFAAVHGYEDCLATLKEYGANLEQLNDDGDAPHKLLEEKQLVLASFVEDTQTNLKPAHPIDIRTASWAQQRFFQLDKLGDRKVWIDWYIGECAAAEEVGSSECEIIEATMSSLPADAIIIHENGSSHTIIGGGLVIGAAMRAGLKYVPAVIGKPIQEFVVSNDANQENDASSAITLN